jgi:hypothetical protein
MTPDNLKIFQFSTGKKYNKWIVYFYLIRKKENKKLHNNPQKPNKNICSSGNKK